MKNYRLSLCFLLLVIGLKAQSLSEHNAVIRINQLGYTPETIKVAVFGAMTDMELTSFSLHDAVSQEEVYRSENPEFKGSYGPFQKTFRLNFSQFQTPGRYYLLAGGIKSPVFRIHADVYDHTADFLLKYMRQQRCGYNPFLTAYCHQDDGYILYNPGKEGEHLDVTGGWHDASDYLQYTATSANAIFQMLFAYSEHPEAFGDAYDAEGLPGPNGMPDVIDEAKFGIDWLLKMNPSASEYYNQIADDRDHAGGYRLPQNDSVVYDATKTGRPVYLASAEKQGMFSFKNRSTGAASTAGKFASAFAIGAEVLKDFYPHYALQLKQRASDAYNYGLKHPGVSQTAPGRAPYFYEEENWVDDMELAAGSLYGLTKKQIYKEQAIKYAQKEQVSPWMGRDTVRHYQYYPFLNAGHYMLAKNVQDEPKQEMASYYKKGLEQLNVIGRENPFYLGIPFVWCSNNFVTAAVTQSRLYHQLTADDTYLEMEAALRDWLFGCNIWGTSMIVGLPKYGDWPEDPHSALNYLEGYQTYGGLIDGPVYGSIANSLIGIQLINPDEYAQFQSDLVVYQDDVGSYSTNEPTMDGTASLIYYLAALEKDALNQNRKKKSVSYDQTGAVVRGDASDKSMSLLFSGHEFADGASEILKVLKKHGIKASFFLTGDFYRNQNFEDFIRQAKDQGHYLGAHSDQHLLYNDWETKERLVDQEEFKRDLNQNYQEMEKFGIFKNATPYFLPPYEWNDKIVTQWANQMDLTLINYTPGTLSIADYTSPQDANYRDSAEILNSILTYEETENLNGFLLLFHLGATKERQDKFYLKLDDLLTELKSKGYTFKSLAALLEPQSIVMN